MTKLFVATPCYGAMVTNSYFQSMLQLVQMYNSEVFTIPFESLIPRARNVCVSAFMKSDCTHLLFIDADISFNAKDIQGMIDTQKEIIAGVYPKKGLKLDLLKKHADSSESLSDLVSKSVGYAFNSKSGRVEPPGIMEVTDAPTGFLLIKRNAIVKLMKGYQERMYKNDIQAYMQYSNEGYFYDLFPSFVDSGRFLSEDYGFCRLWQKLGHQIYIDIRVNLTHTGLFNYTGCPHKYLYANCT